MTQISIDINCATRAHVKEWIITLVEAIALRIAPDYVRASLEEGSVHGLLQ